MRGALYTARTMRILDTPPCQSGMKVGGARTA